MKSIKFSESELEFLQTHYEMELLDAENYVGEVKNILKKLGVIEKEIAKEKPAKSTGKKRGRPKKQANEKISVAESQVLPVVKKEKKAATKKAGGKKPATKAAPKKVAKKDAPVKAIKTPVAKAAPKVKKATSAKRVTGKKVKPAGKTNKTIATPALQSEPAKTE
jgi:adenylate kinase